MALSIVTKTHKSDFRVAAAAADDDDIEDDSTFFLLVFAKATETVYKIKKRVKVFTIKGANNAPHECWKLKVEEKGKRFPQRVEAKQQTDFHNIAPI